jgi:hypothetical protein
MSIERLGNAFLSVLCVFCEPLTPVSRLTSLSEYNITLTAVSSFFQTAQSSSLLARTCKSYTFKGTVAPDFFGSFSVFMKRSEPLLVLF